jgi:hypothetical protein
MVRALRAARERESDPLGHKCALQGSRAVALHHVRVDIKYVWTYVSIHRLQLPRWPYLHGGGGLVPLIR